LNEGGASDLLQSGAGLAAPIRIALAGIKEKFPAERRLSRCGTEGGVSVAYGSSP
jgi:hypothetical protein